MTICVSGVMKMYASGGMKISLEQSYSNVIFDRTSKYDSDFYFIIYIFSRDFKSEFSVCPSYNVATVFNTVTISDVEAYCRLSNFL